MQDGTASYSVPFPNDRRRNVVSHSPQISFRLMLENALCARTEQHKSGHHFDGTFVPCVDRWWGTAQAPTQRFVIIRLIFHLSGKSPESCSLNAQAKSATYTAHLTADEGRWPSSRMCGEMRWTRELRLTCVAQAYGEVVWFGRRGAGAKLRGLYSCVATKAKEPFSGKSTK